MPSENVVKDYQKNSFYHVYNRGVAKSNVFRSRNDMNKFLHYMGNAVERSKVKIVAFCLMSNHFHLIVYQDQKKAMAKCMQSLGTGYTVYFNHKYDLVGSLFQGVYKARRIEDDFDLLRTSVYIHRNPLEVKPGLNLKFYKYSSYPYYIGNKDHPSWLYVDLIKNAFLIDKYCDYVQKQSFETR